VSSLVSIALFFPFVGSKCRSHLERHAGGSVYPEPLQQLGPNVCHVLTVSPGVRLLLGVPWSLISRSVRGKHCGKIHLIFDNEARVIKACVGAMKYRIVGVTARYFWPESSSSRSVILCSSEQEGSESESATAAVDVRDVLKAVAFSRPEDLRPAAAKVGGCGGGWRRWQR
jgi:hypothetical protein